MKGRTTPPPPANQPPSTRSSTDRALWTVVMLAAILATIALVSSSSVVRPGNALALFWVLFDSGPRAALYLTACVGWGMAIVWVLGRLSIARSLGTDRPALAVGLGVSIMLAISHAMGLAGVFGGMMGLSGRAWAYMPIALGVLAAAWPALKALSRGVDLTTLWFPLHWSQRVPIALAWVGGATVLLVAACSPPGALWSSEFGGYDSLSYHLQLPKEWLAAGALRPLDHNVYSYLPGYVEAAFMHLGATTGSPDLLAGDGTVLLSCHLLIAGFTVLAAWTCGRFAMAMARSCGTSLAAADLASAAIAPLVVVVPWILVTGSLAYNESPMVLLFASACTLAIGSARDRPAGEPPVPPLAATLIRGLLCGWLIGVSCSAKPTMIFMGAPVAGLLMLAAAPRRHWGLAAAAACFAGAAAIAPWLIRNWLASQNPVFPQAASLFGAGHWSADQLARYAAAHHFEGSLLDRLGLMIFPDTADPSGARHRGLLHPQWAWFFPAAVAAVIVLWAARPARRVAAVLGAAIILQLAAWLTLTHIQSRFLIPLIVTGSAAIGVVLAIACDSRRAPSHTAATANSRPAWTAPILGAILWGLVPATAFAVLGFLEQGSPSSGPNALLAPGPGALSGSIYRPQFDSAAPDEQRAFLSDAPPPIFCNFTHGRHDTLLLLGDATPLYFTGAVLYSTTYDTSPLAQAIRAAPDSPPRWVDALKSRGITRVLVNFSEIRRLTRSGWWDPAITPEAIEASIGKFSQIERAWGAEEGRTAVLYRLP